MSWANNYGITTPVVADAGWQLFQSFFNTGNTPQAVLLAPGMRVVKVGWISENDIVAALP